MVTRVNGFSGMDIDSMVKSMMTVKRAPLNKLYQQKETLNWTRDSYREISSKLYDFRINKLSDKYNLSSSLNANKSVVTGYTGAVKAEATAAANGVDMEIKVERLASTTTLKTSGVGSGKTSKMTLAELASSDDLAKEYTLNINDATFTKTDGTSLFTGATTIASFISTVNADSKANVIASFDEATGKLVIRSKASGEPIKDSTSMDRKIELGEDNSILTLFNGGKEVVAGDIVEGKDALVNINGKDITQKSNTFTINGMKLTLLDVSTGKEPTTISSQSDPDKAIETIKSFVEDYNSLLQLLNNKVNEAKYSDYAPLTDEQKSEMKESEIIAWTAKAKSGLLKNDDILKSTIISMRTIITEKLGGLSGMGITTGTYSEGGKLILNESKLKDALTNNPQSVIELFQGSAGAASEGLFSKLGKQLATPLENISKRAGTNKYTTDITSAFKEDSVMGKRLKDYNNQISNLLTRLDNYETRLYKQFAAMETAMNKLQTQSSSLFSSTS